MVIVTIVLLLMITLKLLSQNIALKKENKFLKLQKKDCTEAIKENLRLANIINELNKK